jgi:hypothetical protein
LSPDDEEDRRYLADGLGSGNYMLNVIPFAGLFSGSVWLEGGGTVERDLRVKRPNRVAAQVQ